jgi:hypothetical protein
MNGAPKRKASFRESGESGMNQAAFKKSVQALFKQQEKLLARRNRKVPGGNGIYDRYEFPVLTAAHAPITWRYDLDRKTNPLSA